MVPKRNLCYHVLQDNLTAKKGAFFGLTSGRNEYKRMKCTDTLVVKGTQYYKASDALKKGTLVSGAAIKLVHQPDNPYDKNAVEVRLKRTRTMIGHVSGEIASKFAFLVNTDRIIEAFVANVSHQRDYIRLEIQVIYEKAEEDLFPRHKSRLWQSANLLPPEPGVYAIKNLETGRQYVGSSTNIRDRVISHSRDLFLGTHHNDHLQTDFRNLGPDYFEANFVLKNVGPSSLAEVEASHIEKLLYEGRDLYNLTFNGKGSPYGRYRRGHFRTPDPVSDRIARQRAVENLQRKAEKRRNCAVNN